MRLNYGECGDDFCDGDLPDCCNHIHNGMTVYYCCDKHLWKYLVYGSISLIAAIVLIGVKVWSRWPEQFENFWKGVWSCLKCGWIRRNFVATEERYENI